MARSESLIRVKIAPSTAYQMWSDFTSLPDFLPSVLDVKSAGQGNYSITLRAGEGREVTRVAYSVIEKPRHLVWRSKGGAKWNGEVIFRPTTDGTEIRYIVDFEPSSLRERPTERGTVVPVWNVAADLLAFQNYVEKVAVAELEQEAAEAVNS